MSDIENDNEIITSVYDDLDRLDFSFLDEGNASVSEYSNEVKDRIFNVLQNNRLQLLLNGISKIGDEIDNLEVFSRGKKMMKTCFRGETIPFVGLIPYLFAGFKEASLGKRKSNRSIVEQDLNGVDMSHLHVIDAPSTLTKVEIFEEIRNAIEHSRCMLTDNGYLFIDNPANPPKHAYNFKAITDILFLVDFILAQNRYDRRISEYYSGFNTDPIKFSKIDENVVRNDFKFWHTMKKNSAKYPIVAESKTVSEISDQINHFDFFDEDEFEKVDLDLTDNQCGMISDFFFSHLVDSGNLNYIADNLIDHNQSDMSNFALLNFFWSDKNWDSKYQDLVDEAIGRIDLSFSLGIIKSRYPNSDEINSILESIAKSLPKIKQKNGQPLLWHKKGIVDFVQKKFSEAGFYYDIATSSFIKGDQVFGGPMWSHFISSLFNVGRSSRYDIECFPNRLRIQLMRLIYANIPLDLLLEIEKSDNVSSDNLGSMNKTNGKIFTEEERIRNAFAHNTYTLLHGVDYILLRDGYNKKDNSWSWEKKFNIDELLHRSFSLIDKVCSIENFSGAVD